MSLCKRQVGDLVALCQGNNLQYSSVWQKQKRWRWTSGGGRILLPSSVEESVELVTTIKYLALYLSSDLTWATNTASIVRKAHQCLYLMRRLTQAGLSAAVPSSFYSCGGERPDHQFGRPTARGLMRRHCKE